MINTQDKKDEARQKTAEAQEEAKKVDAAAREASIKAAGQKDAE